MTNRILCHERETLLMLNFFQLMEQHCSWDSIFILIYQIDIYDLKNGKCVCERVMKKRFKSLSINPAEDVYLHHTYPFSGPVTNNPARLPLQHVHGFWLIRLQGARIFFHFKITNPMFFCLFPTVQLLLLSKSSTTHYKWQTVKTVIQAAFKTDSNLGPFTGWSHYQVS